MSFPIQVNGQEPSSTGIILPPMTEPVAKRFVADKPPRSGGWSVGSRCFGEPRHRRPRKECQCDRFRQSADPFKGPWTQVGRCHRADAALQSPLVWSIWQAARARQATSSSEELQSGYSTIQASACDCFARSFNQPCLVYLGWLRVYRLPASRWPCQNERREPVNPQANHHAWKLVDVVNCALKRSSLCTYCAYRGV